MTKTVALVLKDDFSGYAWFSPILHVIASNAMEVIEQWKRKFTVPQYWVSDQGAYLTNELLQSVASMQNMQHEPTVSYLLWVNGTVESLTVIFYQLCALC